MGNNRQGPSSESTFTVSFNDEMNAKEKRSFFTGNVLVSTFLYGVIYLSLLSMFPVKAASFIPLILGVILIVGLHYFDQPNQKRVLIILILGTMTIGFIVLGNSYIVNGLLLMMNEVAEVVGKQTGFVMPYYAITMDPEMYRFSVNSFLCLFSALLAFTSVITVKNGSRLLLWLFMIPVFVFQMYSGIAPSIYHNIALLLGVVLITTHAFVQRTSENKLLGKSEKNVILSTSLIVIVLFSFTFLILNYIKPVASYSKSPIITNVEHHLAGFGAEVRYEKSKTNTFTEGRFEKLGKLELLDVPALKVVMDQPTSLYLKGYVGAQYTNDGWTELDKEVSYNSHGLFYWLNQSKFGVFNQLSQINGLDVNRVNDDEQINITVNNVNANSKYFYIPYELYTNHTQFEDAKPLDDRMLLSASFRGNRLYNYQATPNLVTTYPALATYIYETREMDETKAYLKNENHYNEFVYENYTKVPQDIELLFQNHLGVVSNVENSHIAYEKAIEAVTSYLNENIKYKVDMETLSREKDFLKTFLEESKEGYATHYATTATLMFRYLGIPSRYVEGYLITPNDVDGISEFEEIVVKGTNAHAWTEIYVDEMGWIPIEVTPPYHDKMGKTDISGYAGGNSDALESEEKLEAPLGDSELGKQEVIDDEQERNMMTSSQSKEKRTLFQNVLIGISLLVLILLAAYVIYAIRKRLALKKRKEGFRDSNYQVAIPKVFAYSMFLLHYDGISKRGGSSYGYREELEGKYPEEYILEFEKALGINQESLFSQREISIENYDQMTSFMDQTLVVVKPKNLFRRIKMKLWDFIY